MTDSQEDIQARREAEIAERKAMDAADRAEAKRQREAEIAESKAKAAEEKRIAKEIADKKRAEAKAVQDRYMALDFTNEERYRQASRRVYYMKTNKKNIDPRSPLIDIPRRADNLLAKLKYWDKLMNQYQKDALVEHAKGNKELSEQAYNKHDEAVKNFLYQCYGIGILYGQFVEGLGL